MTKIDGFLQTFLIDEPTFDLMHSRAEKLPKRFFQKDEDYVRFEKKGEVDPSDSDAITYTTLVMVQTTPHKDVRVEDLSGGVFDVDISVYMRVI